MSGKWLVSAVLVAVAANSVVLGGEVFGPKSWPVVTACAYLLVVVQQGWANLGRDMAAQVPFRTLLPAPSTFCTPHLRSLP